jgi:hypothetical protein
MFWFFERQNSRLHYEVRRQTDGDNFELVITHPDGHLAVEQFGDPLSLSARMQQLQCTLRAEGWRPPAQRMANGRATA